MIFIGITILSLIFWILMVICLKDCNKIIISGYSTASEDEKKKYKQKYDVAAMNKFLGKVVFLPLSVFCTALIPIFVYEGMLYGLLIGIITGIGSIIILILGIYATVVILDGDKFKIK